MAYADLSQKDKETEMLNLLNKIRRNTAGGGEGGFITLSDSDYDYPSGSPDRVALWNLDPGYYVVDGTNVLVQFGQGDNHPIALDTGDIVIAVGNGDIIYTQRKNNDFGFYAGIDSKASILTLAQTQDTLASASKVLPLSANQGKVLSEMISSLDERVTALEQGGSTTANSITFDEEEYSFDTGENAPITIITDPADADVNLSFSMSPVVAHVTITPNYQGDPKVALIEIGDEVVSGSSTTITAADSISGKSASVQLTMWAPETDEDEPEEE